MTQQAAIEKACAHVAAAKPLVNPRYYPGFHVAPPCGWMNDPNGFCYALGRYHVFYQFHPYSAVWGPMHWGHAVSDDLLHWEDLPVALAPSEDYDRDGCFSGSAIEYEGELFLIYTGHTYLKKFGDDELIREVQCLAVSHDGGISFEKLGVVIEPPEGVMHFRDPKIWKAGDKFRVAVGGRTVDTDQGIVVLYESDDLRRWTKLGLIDKAEGGLFMYECPDFFTLDDEGTGEKLHVLLTSPMGLKPDGRRFNNPSVNSYKLMRPKAGGKCLYETVQDQVEADRGLDFYAAQTCPDKNGRRVMISWLNMWHVPYPSVPDGWNSALTLPRYLSLKDGVISQEPVDLSPLYLNTAEYESIQAENEEKIISAGKSCLALSFKVKSSAAQAGLRISGSIYLYFDRINGTLTLQRLEGGRSGARSLPVKDGETEIRVILDRCLLEVFYAGQSMTAMFFDPGLKRELALYAANGRAEFSAVTLHELKAPRLEARQGQGAWHPAH